VQVVSAACGGRNNLHVALGKKGGAKNLKEEGIGDKPLLPSSSSQSRGKPKDEMGIC